MNVDLKRILDLLKDSRNLDFSCYRETIVERRIKNRFAPTKSHDCTEYLIYLKEHPDELDNLIDSLTINVSRFFRDSLTFEYIADKILPALVYSKKEPRESFMRLWSAGCAMGEEPYSAAILIHEFLQKESLNFDVNIFATDIDHKTLKKAQKAAYPFEGIQNVKYGLVKKYFITEKQTFHLISDIKKMVSFSYYNILDKKSYAPPESIFGCFDMVFCRNLLIYFDTVHQNLILDKLYRSLSKHGYLVLGETEIPLSKHRRNFKRVNDCCHIYQKT